MTIKKREKHVWCCKLTTSGGVNYAIRLLPRGQPQWWWKIWLPAWHEGRGRYVSIGLWLFAVYRGY